MFFSVIVESERKNEHLNKAKNELQEALFHSKNCEDFLNKDIDENRIKLALDILEGKKDELLEDNSDGFNTYLENLTLSSY